EKIVGGLVGRLQSGSVQNSYAKGDVTGKYYRAGGLLGVDIDTEMNNSFFAGEAKTLSLESGEGTIGGLVGGRPDNATNSYWLLSENNQYPSRKNPNKKGQSKKNLGYS
ncbi:hypothetical protein CBF23_015090, partial [Marinomonas agarivorans]